jgi:hypothetical protein
MLIDTMIIGAQKAGTSSLAALIEQHPLVSSHRSLEVSSFVVDSERKVVPTNEVLAYFDSAAPDGGKLLGKSAGTMFVRGAMERLQRYNEHCSCVVILRDPVARAASAYLYMRLTGFETERSFGAALAAENERLTLAYDKFHPLAYRARGRYAEQLERVYDIVGRDRVKVVFFDDLKVEPDTVAREILQFMSLPAGDLTFEARHENAAAKPRSASAARLLRKPPAGVSQLASVLPRSARDRIRRRLLAANAAPLRAEPIDPAVVDELRAYFAPWDRRLAELLEQPLPWESRPC